MLARDQIVGAVRVRAKRGGCRRRRDVVVCGGGLDHRNGDGAPRAVVDGDSGVALRCRLCSHRLFTSPVVTVIVGGRTAQFQLVFSHRRLWGAVDHALALAEQREWLAGLRDRDRGTEQVRILLERQKIGGLDKDRLCHPLKPHLHAQPNAVVQHGAVRKKMRRAQRHVLVTVQ